MRKEEEESINEWDSRNASVMFLCQSSRLIEADPRADKMAKYELKLFSLRKCFIILRNLSTYFSRSLCSSQLKIWDRVQKDILLKCSVNRLRLGISSSFCSFAQIMSSGICEHKTKKKHYYKCTHRDDKTIDFLH